MPQDFPQLRDDFTALVIGAGRGIGAGIVRRLLDSPQCGRVIAASRTADRAGFPESVKLQCEQLDVTDEESIKGLAGRLADAGTGLDLVIYAAGLLHDTAGLQPEKQLADISMDTLQRVFATNTFGAMLCGRHFGKLMPTQEGAVFAAISARVGSIGDNRLGGWYAYRASKAALNQFLKTMGIEFSRKKKRAVVLALHPGTTDTALSKPFQSGVPDEKLFSVDFTVDRLLRNIANARPDDSGSFIAWDGQRIEW